MERHEGAQLTFIKEGEPDFILIGELREGDLDAYNALVFKFSDYAMNCALQFVKNRERARILADNALQQLWEFRHLIPDEFTAFISPPIEDYIGKLIRDCYKSTTAQSKDLLK
jgi:hypothetical protein